MLALSHTLAFSGLAAPSVGRGRAAETELRAPPQACCARTCICAAALGVCAPGHLGSAAEATPSSPVFPLRMKAS